MAQNLKTLLAVFAMLLAVACGGGGDGDGEDTTPPRVSSVSPDDGATDIATDTTITATFSEAMDASSIDGNSFTLTGAGAVNGTVTYNSTNRTATFTPAAPLAAGTTYTATITTEVEDANDNHMAANQVWNFTTGSGDTTPPTVSATNPLHLARGALLSGPITATFDEPLDPATVSVSSFVVTDPSGAVAGSVALSPDGRTISFTPQAPLSYTTRYDVQLTTAISDAAGNPLGAAYEWHFNSGKRLAAGGSHTCARLDDGGLKCWGSAVHGQLGLGDTVNRGALPGDMGANLPRVDVGSGRSVVQVTAGRDHTCARLDNGAVKCWGLNGDGQLGLGDTDNRGNQPGEMGDNLPAVDLGSGRTALEVSAGTFHTCARLDDHSVKCWGIGEVLGLGDSQSRGDNPGEMGDNLPAVNLGINREARRLSVGFNYACVRMDNGRVKCWGHNFDGQLGLGDTQARGDNPGEMGGNLPPVDLGTGRTAVVVVTGSNHTCARLDDDSIKCWGANAFGKLGLGDTESRGDAANEMGDQLPAVDLGSGRTAMGLNLGVEHTCARLDDDTLKCWGLNSDGQLGLGDTDARGDAANEMGDQLPAVNLGSGLTPRELVAADERTCVRVELDAVKCWGSNTFGQLGLGDTENRGDQAGEMGDNLPTADIGS